MQLGRRGGRSVKGVWRGRARDVRSVARVVARVCHLGAKSGNFRLGRRKYSPSASGRVFKG